MRTRRPRHRWEWDRALVAAQLGANAWATGHAWATHRWHWDPRLSEDQVVTREGGVSLEDFRRLYRTDRALSSLRRDFKDLVDAGLLVVRRRHSPASPNVYVPRVPDLASAAPEDAPEEASAEENTAQQRAVNSAQQRAVSDGNTARQRAEHRSDDETAPLSPELQEPPSRAHVRTRAREDGPGGGGSWSPQETAQVDHALREVLGALPPDVTPDITVHHRDQCRPVLWQLLVAGWRPYQLATKVSRRGWKDVDDPGAVLRTRLVRLLDLEPPYRPQPAAVATATRRAQASTEAASHAPAPPEDFRAVVDQSRPSGRPREQEVSA